MSTNYHDPIHDTEEYRDHIATVDESGKRNWIYPKKQKGPFYYARTYVSWGLLAILFLLPFVKLNGKPFILLNVLERKFILFGIPFMPQDFHLFVLAMLTFMVFIILFTVVFGRLFCGWVCPQTIFMEMVFRKIEYWIEGDANAQRRLNKAPWTRQKIIKKVGKQAIFFAIAVLISNVFLSYIIGVEEVFRIASEPIQQNLGGFIAMIIFSAAFYFVFSYMREQVCIAVCPYGRLQGVLLDKNSIVVHYDFERGEPRGKIKKNKKKKAAAPKTSDALEEAKKMNVTAAEVGANPLDKMEEQLGDCIDCKLCVQVCPTGIDIRNGTQMECINCTACIDACDEVMEKIGREKKLIRYDSYSGIVEKRKKLFTPRVIAYSAVLVVLLAVNAFLLTSRSKVETIFLRAQGSLFQKVDDNTYSNLYNYQIINKTSEEMPIEFVIKSGKGKIEFIGNEPVAIPEDKTEGVMFIKMDKADLNPGKNNLIIETYSEGKLVDEAKTSFFGPPN